VPISNAEFEPGQIYEAMTIIENTGNSVAGWMEIYNKTHSNKETDRHKFTMKIIKKGEGATDDNASFEIIVLTGLKIMMS